MAPTAVPRCDDDKSFATEVDESIDSRSRLTIRPFGPVPLISLRSIPDVFAIRRANGLANVRPLSVWAWPFSLLSLEAGDSDTNVDAVDPLPGNAPSLEGN